MDAAAQLDALQPGEDELGSFDPAQLAQGDCKAVLARVAAQLAKHERGRDGALLDRRCETKDHCRTAWSDDWSALATLSSSSPKEPPRELISKESLPWLLQTFPAVFNAVSIVVRGNSSARGASSSGTAP